MTTAMAVATVFSSSRTTKGLFLIFTLLSLLCFTNSLMGKNQLEKLKEEYENLRTKADQVKADFMAGMEEAVELGRDLDQKMALRQEEMKKRFPDFPALDTYFENNKRYLEEYKDYVNKKYEDIGEKIENQENNMRTLKNIIEFLEEYQAEL